MEYLGEICAVSAALTWSFSVILFKRSEAVSPTAMNLFKNVVATALLALTLPVLGVGIDWGRSQADWAMLIVSGLFGIALADTLVFVGLRKLGAGRMAICECVYAPSIVALSVIFLGEPMTGVFLLGGALVVGGVTLATVERKGVSAALGEEVEAADVAPVSLVGGVVAGVVAMIAMAIGVILAKPVLERGHLVEVTFVRTAAGIGGQLLWIAARRDGASLRVFTNRSVWKTLVPASILGTYVAMLFWLGGFKWASASVAAVLNQLSSVFTILLAWWLLKEPLTRRRALGGLVAIGGAVLVLVGRPA